MVGLISGHSYSTPSMINLSMVGYDVLIVLILVILKNRGKIYFAEKNIIQAFILFFAVLVIRFLVDGIGMVSNKIFDNYFLPLISAYLMVQFLTFDDLPKVIKVLYICIIINAVIGCVEYIIGKSLFLHNYYMSNVDWYPSTFLSTQYNIPFRCTTFLGHPLVNGMYYLMGIVYLLNNKGIKNISKILQSVILIGGILATNSRAALLVLAVYLLYYLISNKKGIKLILLLMASICIYFTVNLNEIYSNLFVRDASGSSAMVRILALQSIIQIPEKSLLLGVGFNNAGQVFKQMLAGANAEISYLIILLELGLIGFILWFGACALVYNNNIKEEVNNLLYKGLVKGMLICFLLYAAFSNSFGDPGTLNYLLFFILGLTRVGKQKISASIGISTKEEGRNMDNEFFVDA